MGCTSVALGYGSSGDGSENAQYQVTNDTEIFWLQIPINFIENRIKVYILRCEMRIDTFVRDEQIPSVYLWLSKCHFV